MERPLRPAGRLPRPARRPLVRLRATHQGPYRAREGTDKRSVHHVDYSMTRVNLELGARRARVPAARHAREHRVRRRIGGVGGVVACSLACM